MTETASSSVKDAAQAYRWEVEQAEHYYQEAVKKAEHDYQTALSIAQRTREWSNTQALTKLGDATGAQEVGSLNKSGEIVVRNEGQERGNDAI